MGCESAEGPEGLWSVGRGGEAPQAPMVYHLPG